MVSKRRLKARRGLRAAMQPRQLAWGLNLLLGGLIAWAAVAVVQGLTAPLASVTPRVIAPPAVAPPAPALNLDALLAARLFGQAAPTADEVAIEEAVADSSLHLLGVLHDARSERSRALIAIDGMEPVEGSHYSPGQELRPGLVLEEVLPNAALLRTGNRRFRLQLDPGALSGAGATAALPAAEPDAEEAELPDTDPGAVRAAIRRDPAQVSKYFRYEAAGKDSPREGYYLYPGSDPGAYTAANLQPGDLLVSLNGIPATPANAASLAAALQFSPRVSLGLVRAGQAMSLEFDLE